MTEVIRADQVKFNFDELKDTWSSMLGKYFDHEGRLLRSASIETSCPHCSEIETKKPFTLNGFRHVVCCGCETLYVSPRLNDQCIDELYSDEFYSAQYTKAMLPAFEIRKKIIGQNKYDQLLEMGANKGSVLDIGSGIGEVSEVFKDNSWDTHVIEMSPAAIDWLKTRNHKEVFHGSLNNYETTKCFDVIMAWGVVEHVVDPKEFLNKVYSLLKPNGIFVSEVPHGNSLLVDYCRNNDADPKRILMGEQHIKLYSIEAYKDLHASVGLTEVHVQTNGLDIDTILNISNEKLPDSLVAGLQKCIDRKNYGDLLRGFWKKGDSLN